MSLSLVRSQPVDILLVDDQQRNLDALSAVLAHSDYNLIQARSAAEALPYVLEREFAVVLLDVMMPDIDGFECARMLKAQAPEMPIIFVTAVANDMDFVFRGYGVGAVDYVTKPIDPMIVQTKVAVFAQLFRARRLLKEQLEATKAVSDRLERELTACQKDHADVVGQLKLLVERFEGSLIPLVPGSRLGGIHT